MDKGTIVLLGVMGVGAYFIVSELQKQKQVAIQQQLATTSQPKPSQDVTNIIAGVQALPGVIKDVLDFWK